VAQLAFDFSPRAPDKPVWQMTPCEHSGEMTPGLNRYCGFRRDFTKHDWCARHYVGYLADDGSIVGCACVCHDKAGVRDGG
jgi:hypothetical protein